MVGDKFSSDLSSTCHSDKYARTVCELINVAAFTVLQQLGSLLFQTSAVVYWKLAENWNVFGIDNDGTAMMHG